MPAGGELRVEQFAVDDDLETPAVGGDEFQFLNGVRATHRLPEGCDQRLRQTGGTGGEVSLDAEFNADLHQNLLNT